MGKSILVPHDFTQIGDYAIEHAYMIAKASKNPIHIIHVVKTDDEIKDAEKKLKKIADDFFKDKDIAVTTTIRKGKTFKEIYKYGLEIEATLVVLGSDGLKSIKRAMKVVRKFEKIPFIIVQSPVIFGEYSKIISPLDTDRSSRIKMLWINYLNSLFHSTAYIVTCKEKDRYKVKNLANNLRFAVNWLDNKLIDYEVITMDNKENFADDMYSYADKIEADMVLIMAHKYRSYIKDLKKVENIELYKKIPIMCVNKRTDILKVGGFN
jgi:hypothetical protein